MPNTVKVTVSLRLVKVEGDVEEQHVSLHETDQNLKIKRIERILAYPGST